MFKLLPDGTGYEKLLDLNCPSTGCTPKGALYFDGTFLYGMTDLGGTSNSGTIFKIMTDGSNFEKLFDFDGDANGSNPFGELISAGGFLYGLSSSDGAFDDGTLFKIGTDGSGFETLFDYNPLEGSNPFGSLLLDGSFVYGMTGDGGEFGRGVIFKYQLAATNIASHDLPDNFTVFPNPATDKLSVAAENTSTRINRVEVYNAHNKLVSTSVVTDPNFEIDLSDQPRGIYFVKFYDGSLVGTKKVVLQ